MYKLLSTTIYMSRRRSLLYIIHSFHLFFHGHFSFVVSFAFIIHGCCTSSIKRKEVYLAHHIRQLRIFFGSVQFDIVQFAAFGGEKKKKTHKVPIYHSLNEIAFRTCGETEK